MLRLSIQTPAFLICAADATPIRSVHTNDRWVDSLVILQNRKAGARMIESQPTRDGVVIHAPPAQSSGEQLANIASGDQHGVNGPINHCQSLRQSETKVTSRVARLSILNTNTPCRSRSNWGDDPVAVVAHQRNNSDSSNDSEVAAWPTR